MFNSVTKSCSTTASKRCLKRHVNLKIVCQKSLQRWFEAMPKRRLLASRKTSQMRRSRLELSQVTESTFWIKSARFFQERILIARTTPSLSLSKIHFLSLSLSRSLSFPFLFLQSFTRTKRSLSLSLSLSLYFSHTQNYVDTFMYIEGGCTHYIR